jgi:hypothetical protein
MDVDLRIATPRQPPALQQHQSWVGGVTGPRHPKNPPLAAFLMTSGGPLGAQWSVAPPARSSMARTAAATGAVPRVRAPGASRATGPTPPARTTPAVRPVPAAVRAVTIVVGAVRAGRAAERRV